MVDNARALKMADRVKVIVAEMLETRVKDPRLGFVTITDARMTGDLQHATLFYTVLGTPEDQASTAAALESAKGVLRSEVGKQTGLRLTPTLEFLADAVPENASHIDELLAAAAARDAEVAALAATELLRRGRRPLPPSARGPRRRRRRRRRGRRRRGRRDRPSAADARLTPASRPRGSWSSTSRPAGPAMTSWPGSAGWRAPARSGTRARSTRWPPAYSCSAWARAPGC